MTIGLSESDNFPFVEQNNTSSQSQAHKTQRRKTRESSFQPHPLYWGTADQQSVQEALRQVEEDNKENTKDEWEVLKEVARQFPDLGNGNLILLDENYVPFGKKNYMDSNYKPLNEEAAPK